MLSSVSALKESETNQWTKKICLLMSFQMSYEILFSTELPFAILALVISHLFVDMRDVHCKSSFQFKGFFTLSAFMRPFFRMDRLPMLVHPSCSCKFLLANITFIRSLLQMNSTSMCEEMGTLSKSH